ncbi:MAG: cation transporter [Treponema sp.]|jgi:copper chaperone CopZ|nr:cation transporter [Treponema sp.]
MKTTLNIEGMTCNHCVEHLTQALKHVNSVTKVKVSLKEKTATVDHKENIALSTFKEVVAEAGYEVV